MGSRLDANSGAVRKRIQSHAFEDEDGEEYEASTFGGFADYIRRKKVKLQNLDAEIRASSANNPPIFRGVVAHVNGYTQPSLNDLHHLIVSHGGGFLQYLDGKTNATHIIASALTPKKREEFRKYRIVKPAWVVESIKAGRLLPWDEFRVIDEGPSQRILRFENGLLQSQANDHQHGYKEQTDSSWYTSQLKDAAEDLQKSTPPTQLPKASTEMPQSNPSMSGETDYGEFPTLESSGDANHKHIITEGQQGQQEPVKEDESLADAPSDVTPVKAGAEDGPPSYPLVRETIPAKPDMTPEEYNAQLLSDPRMRKSSVMNPEFLQQFYRESRLHHLSTWKAELKAKLQAAAQEKLQAQTAMKRRVPGARRYILHVDFDSFFAAVSIQKHHPELADKPVAIAHGTGSGSEIASCNYPARTHGIKNGMWMKAALEMCPELKVLPYDFPAYEEASRQFYSCILAVDGIVQSVSIDEALIDITTQCLEAGGSDGRGVSEGSIYREQAKADEVARHLREAIKEKTGCAVSVGIGGNILQAKVALRKAKPAGQFQLKPDAVLEFIGNLTVQDLPGVAYSLGAKLEELGVKFVKDLRELSREKLVSSLGPKTGAKLWDYARGIDRTEVGVQTVRKSVSAEINWGIRFVNQAQAEEFLQNLSEELHRRLVENLVKGKQLTIRVMRRSPDAPLEPVKHLGHGKCDVFNKSVMLGVATNASDVIGKEAISMLRSFGFSPGDLRGLGVQMTKLEPVKPDGRAESSQRQLNFKASPKKPVQNLDPDELESPQKGETSVAADESLQQRPSLDDKSQKPLNISGTQFVMPSQADPKVVAELPGDIRSKLVPKSRVSNSSRAASPSPAPRAGTGGVELPPQSQLDPEILDALPEDVRAEVLSYYNRPEITRSQPQRPPVSNVTRPTTPTKKRRGRPPKSSSNSIKSSSNSTLTQTSLTFARPRTADSTAATSSRQPSPAVLEPDEMSEEVLAALPEDIRREVLEEQRQARLQQRLPARKPAPKPAAASTTTSAAPQKRLRLPPLPEKPTFTAKKLSTLPELREAVGAWYSAFAAEGPFVEDVTALARYLRRVVLEERDIDKAVSVANWLGWLIEDGRSADSSKTDKAETKTESESPDGDRSRGAEDSNQSWDEALKTVRDSVNDAVRERGLPPVDFL
ncbi:hypothetical protein VTN77DRAFT_6488 [Rasamsonia byssochlamydoides]|uniref:uncharacterized protein n=1 Tax=Rasamsonia byssochlamydoides TaxID=89139 RepID=UPI003742829B